MFCVNKGDSGIFDHHHIIEKKDVDRGFYFLKESHKITFVKRSLLKNVFDYFGTPIKRRLVGMVGVMKFWISWTIIFVGRVKEIFGEGGRSKENGA